MPLDTPGTFFSPSSVGDDNDCTLCSVTWYPDAEGVIEDDNAGCSPEEKVLDVKCVSEVG